VRASAESAATAFGAPPAVPVSSPPGQLQVVILTHELTRGGRAKSSVDLSCSLARLGYRVTCLAHPRFGVPEHSAAQLAAAGAELRLLPAGRVVSPPTVLRVVAALSRLSPDVLVVHSGPLVALLAPLKGHYGNPRLIFAKRGFWDPRGLWRPLLRRAAGRVNAVAAVSHAVARFWALAQPDWDPSSIFVIHNGVAVPAPNGPSRDALREELGLPKAAKVVGTVARMDWEKGHQHLIESLPLVLGRVTDAHLVLAGDGAYLPELRRLAANLGLAERTHFLGWREDVATVMRGMDVFVHATLLETTPYQSPGRARRGVPLSPDLAGEPFGRAVIEAGAVGVPVVATDAGGHRECVVHGETGLLVPVAAPEALAEAVLQLLTHPDEARRMGEAARQRVLRDFSLSALGRRYHDLVQRLVAPSGS